MNFSSESGGFNKKAPLCPSQPWSDKVNTSPSGQPRELLGFLFSAALLAPWGEPQFLSEYCFLTLKGHQYPMQENSSLVSLPILGCVVGVKPHVFSVTSPWHRVCCYLCSSSVERGVCIFTQQKPHHLSALGDLISFQIIFGLLERRTHCTFSVGLIISILETVIYEILTFSHHVFTPSKAKNIVIVCDVLKTLVTSWSQMLIDVKRCWRTWLLAH